MSKIKLITILLCLLGNLSQGQITPKKLIKEYKKAHKSFSDSDDMSGLSFTTEGNMMMGDLTVPVKLYVVEQTMRMEMSIMGASYYGVKTDSLSWSYDPMNQLYDFTTDDEPSGATDITSDGDQKFLELLDSGYKPESLSTVRLDSIDAYELRLTLEGDTKHLYFDPATYYLIGYKSDTEEDYYFNHVVFENRLWPTTYITNDGQGLLLKLNSYVKTNKIDPAVFEMTTADRKAYEDYLTAQSQPEPPSESEEYYERGMALYKESKYQEAFELFNKALELNPGDPVILNGRGLAKSGLKDYYGAIADYERAIEKWPDYAVAINNRGLSKYNLSDFDGALKDYQRAIVLDSTNSTFLSNLGMVYMQKGDFDQMANYFSKAIEYNPSATNYYYRGMARAQIEQYEAALSDYERAEEMGAENPYLSNYKGVTLYSLGDFENALKAFIMAHELDSSQEQYLLNIANTQRELTQYQASIETYNKIIALDSTNAYGYASRAVSEYDLDQLERALNDINKAISLYNENALYFDYRGYIKLDMKDFEGAIRDFTQSLKMEQDSHIYYKRGLAKIELKDDSGACEDFQKSADLEDENGKESLIKYCKN